jgi:hypothetical protein
MTSLEIAELTGKQHKSYQLTKTECLYIATKFIDEARAKLVLRYLNSKLGYPNF